jgi:hypothetical protein
MRAKSKKTASLTKTKQRTKTAAKRSRDTLLKSAPAVAPEVHEQRGGNRWLIGLLVLIAIGGGIALITSSNSFRSRAEVSPNEIRPAVQLPPMAAAVRADPLDQTQSIPDPEADARRDYVLALATGSTEALDLFLARHPDGFHADLARMQRKRFAERELPNVIRQLNVELKRVGCGPTGNAEWTAQSQQALTAFNKHAQTSFDAKAPDADMLKVVKQKTARVCPVPPAPKAAEVAPKRGFFWE